jgi:hypothetical protein
MKKELMYLLQLIFPAEKVVGNEGKTAEVAGNFSLAIKVIDGSFPHKGGFVIKPFPAKFEGNPPDLIICSKTEL